MQGSRERELLYVFCLACVLLNPFASVGTWEQPILHMHYKCIFTEKGAARAYATVLIGRLARVATYLEYALLMHIHSTAL